MDGVETETMTAVIGDNPSLLFSADKFAQVSPWARHKASL